jgi:hypothetical protein
MSACWYLSQESPKTPLHLFFSNIWPTLTFLQISIQEVPLPGSLPSPPDWVTIHTMFPFVSPVPRTNPLLKKEIYKGSLEAV